jgi:hypothetical protein
MDGMTLDARTLLIAARAVGLVVTAVGSSLAVHGPKGAAPLATLLLSRKSEVLALVEAELPAAAVHSTLAPRPVADLAATTWPPRPVELASWPPEWRKRWGHLANELEAQGVAWNVAEQRAFAEVSNELAAYEAERGPVERVAPTEALSDVDAHAGIAGLKWDGTSLAPLLEEARVLNRLTRKR